MLGIELTGSSIRVVQWQGRGPSARIEGEFREQLPRELNASSADELGAWLKAKLKEAGLKGGDSVALFGRGAVAVKSLRVPVVPDRELPAVVAYSIETVAAAETVLDFQPGPVQSSEGADGPEQFVFAGTVAASYLEALRKMSAKAGVTIKKASPRAYGTRAFVESAGVTLPSGLVLVHLADDSVEISLWTGAALRLLRWLPISGGASDRLANEIRRTLASFSSEDPESRLDGLLVVGEVPEGVENALAGASSLPVQVVDSRGLPAPVLPLVGCSADDKKAWPIDFLKPKRTQETTNQRRPLALLAALLAVIVGGGGWFLVQRAMANRDVQISSLNDQLAQLTQQINELKPMVDRHAVIREWIDAGDPLLDELQEIAAALPDTSDLFLTGFEYNAGQNGQSGTVKLDGLSRLQSTVTQAQTQLASGDHRYEVLPRGIDPGADVGAFAWRFGLDINIAPLSMIEYVQRSESWHKQVEALAPPIDMVRNPASLARTPAKPAVAAGTKKSEGGEKQKKESEASDGQGSKVLDDLVETIRQLPPEEREAEIAKKPKFLQKRLRKAVQGGKQ